jgi:excisionase family DNA binding protein
MRPESSLQAARSEEKRLLNVQDAARYLRVHPRTIYSWVRSGRMPCLWVGNRIRFTHEMLVRWAGGEGGRHA